MGEVVRILSAIREFKSFTSDYQLADEFKTKQGNISMWKKRGTIPYSILRKFCQKESLDFEFLLEGRISKKEEKKFKGVREEVKEWVEVDNAQGETEQFGTVMLPIDYPGAKTKSIVKIKMKTNDFVPVAEKGDIVLIDTAINKKSPIAKKEYVIKIKKQFVIAYAEKVKKLGIILQPRNPSMEALPSADCKIVGRIKRIIRDF